MLGLVAMIGTASAATYQVRWMQDDCAEVVHWELYGARRGQPFALVATIPASPTLCAMDPLTTMVDAVFRRGDYAFRLRAVAADGEFADSEALEVRFPLRRPALLEVRR